MSRILHSQLVKTNIQMKHLSFHHLNNSQINQKLFSIIENNLNHICAKIVFFIQFTNAIISAKNFVLRIDFLNQRKKLN